MQRRSALRGECSLKRVCDLLEIRLWISGNSLSIRAPQAETQHPQHINKQGSDTWLSHTHTLLSRRVAPLWCSHRLQLQQERHVTYPLWKVLWAASCVLCDLPGILFFRNPHGLSRSKASCVEADGRIFGNASA